MHGRKKSAVRASASELEAARLKARNYRKLWSHVMAARKCGEEGSLELVAKLLMVNCDSYTLWNYRRELLQSSEAETTNQELELTAQCLRKNPKSYPTWWHRRWAVETCNDRAQVAAHELKLCAQFLEVDERNFHCWNYRRDMSQWAGEAREASEAFARSKLDINFSNYSAFHDLATRLPDSIDAEQARSELDTVSQAIFTEPDDQSAWWYAECVLNKTQDDKVHADHAEALRQLRQLEPTAKWPIVALLRQMHRQRVASDDSEHLHAKLLQLDSGHVKMYGTPIRQSTPLTEG